MKIREVALEDLDGVRNLVIDIGWNPPDEDYWRRLWEDNPSMQKYREESNLARGWVIEHKGEVKGFLANVIQEYRFCGRDLSAATASSFVVAPEARGLAVNLALTFTNQRGVDLLLNTTAAPNVSQIFQFLKFRRMPQPGYGTIYYWVCCGNGFISAAMRRLGWPVRLSRLTGFIAGPLLEALDAMCGRRLSFARKPSLRYEICKLDAINGELEELWRLAFQGKRQLTVLRNRSSIQWHLSIRGDDSARLVCVRSKDKLVGYAAIVRTQKSNHSLTRYRIVDLIVPGAESDVVLGLLSAAFEYARSEGAHILDVQGIDTSIRKTIERARPRCHPNDGWPYLFKVKVPELEDHLMSPDSWYPSMLDGDTVLEPAGERMET